MSSVRSVKVTAREASGVVCPFEGRPVEIYMHVQPGSITYSAPHAFSLQVPVEGLERLVDKATMRNGVAGAVGKSGLPKDPYTGETLSLRDFGDGRYCYTGGFNPRAARESLEELVYFLKMRDGKSPAPRPESLPPVTSVTEKPVAKPHDIELSEETLRAATEAVVMSGKFENRTTVHVSRGRKQR